MVREGEERLIRAGSLRRLPLDEDARAEDLAEWFTRGRVPGNYIPWGAQRATTDHFLGRQPENSRPNVAAAVFPNHAGLPVSVEEFDLLPDRRKFSGGRALLNQRSHEAQVERD